MASLMARNIVTEEEVRMIETPRRTRTYTPAPYGEVIDLLGGMVNTQLRDWSIAKREYGTAKNGNQLFGVWHLENRPEPTYVDVENAVVPMREPDSLRMAIGFRSSHDKTLPLGVIVGASVFVCDNLMFNGRGYKAVRRHRGNAMSSFRFLIFEQLDVACAGFDVHKAERGELKQIDMKQERGYEILGRLFGDRLLTERQLSQAVTDWKHPTFPDAFGERNAWSLYNAVTYGLKKGTPSAVIERYSKAHEWFLDNKSIL